MVDNKMIPPDLKCSPIEPIPESWVVKKLEEILVEGKLGGNYENAEDNNGIPVIKMGNLDRGGIKLDKLQCLPVNEEYNTDDVLMEGDLLFNTRNTLDLVGKVAIWRNELPFAIYNSNLMRMKFDKTLVASNSFMNYVFNSLYVLRQLRGIATGTTSVAAIYGRDLEKVKFALPPLPEQAAIVALLAKWDMVMNKATALLTQQELRKKWLMQQLLSGKKRVKDFNKEKWKIKLLEDALIPVSRPVDKPSSSFLALGIRSHGKGTFLKHDFDPAKIDMETLFIVKENDLIVNITFAWEGAIAIVKKEDDGALVSHRFPTFIINPTNAAIDFFRHLILQPKFKYLLDLISPGGAGRNRVLSKKDFLKLEIKLPSIEEQIAIARVLQSADKEINLLKSKLEKLKEQKRGLMQVLMTGKKRLNMK